MAEGSGGGRGAGRGGEVLMIGCTSMHIIGKTHDQFNLPIFKSPAAKPRLFCPNDFFVYVSGKTDKNLPRQIARAEQDEGTVGDRFGKVGTLVFAKRRKGLDQLRAQLYCT